MVTKNGYELVLGSIFKYTASLNTGGHAVDTLTGFLIDLVDNFEIVNIILMDMQGLTNPLARRPGLVISTFGLAEIISCMPDGLVKIYIGY